MLLCRGQYSITFVIIQKIKFLCLVLTHKKCVTVLNCAWLHFNDSYKPHKRLYYLILGGNSYRFLCVLSCLKSTLLSCFSHCRPVANKRDSVTPTKLLVYRMWLIDLLLACHDHWNAPRVNGASNKHTGAYLLRLPGRHTRYYKSHCVIKKKGKEEKNNEYFNKIIASLLLCIKENMYFSPGVGYFTLLVMW